MDVTWYLVLSALLFAIGAAGVLLRRSPLVILLCLELMLNAGHLALVAFSRSAGNALWPAAMTMLPSSGKPRISQAQAGALIRAAPGSRPRRASSGA